MKIFRDLAQADTAYKNAVIALGNFDGLHLGHRAIIARAQHIAQAVRRPLALMTFEPHPREVLGAKSAPHRIYSLRGKLETAKALGVEAVFLMRFTTAFSTLPADAFIDTILHGQLDAHHIVTGENFYFGKGRGGDKVLLEQKTTQLGIGYTALPPVLDRVGRVISSSAVRTLLGESKVREAGELLGAPYHISGHVVHGEGRGRTLDMPTANIGLDKLFLPRFGVYAARATVAGVRYKAVASLGVKPTFGQHAPLLEAHLFDTAQDMYGKRMTVELLEFIRPEETFTSAEALKIRMTEDCTVARNYNI